MSTRVLSHRQKILIALGSGLVMALSVPPVSFWPLAWVGLVPLYALGVDAKTKGPAQAAIYGFVWGLGFYGIALSWITYLHPLTWMGVPWLGSVAIALFAWGVVTGWGTACVVVWSGALTLTRHLPWTVRCLIVTALWCGLEALRNLSPLDWVSLALTQSPHNLWVLHLGRWSGPTTVVALIVAVNCLLAEAWRHRQAYARRLSLILALCLLIGGHLLGAISYLGTDVTGSKVLRLGLIQGNVPTREKLTPAGIRQALEAYTAGYRDLAAQGADAVLTPEGAIPSVWRFSTRRSSPLIQAVQESGVPLWLGTFMPVPGEMNRLGQSLIEVGPQGRARSRYDKIKLVPLGEYLPLENILGELIGRLSPLDSYLVAGGNQQRFETSLGPAMVSICYESAYSSWLRQQAARGGEFLLTAANNDPYPPWMMVQHHALDVMRAVETNRWTLRATNTGLSGVVDNRGRTRWRSVPNTYALHLATIYPHRSQTPYVRWGNWLLPLLIGGSLVSVGRIAIRKMPFSNK